MIDGLVNDRLAATELGDGIVPSGGGVRRLQITCVLTVDSLAALMQPVRLRNLQILTDHWRSVLG